MELRGKRVAILAENTYEDQELWYPYYRLREAGADVFVVGTGSSTVYTSKHGYPVKVDAEAATVDASQFDLIVIPGGWAPDLMRRSPAMVGLVRQASEQGRLVAAICHAGWMLCSANIIRGRRVTSAQLDQGRHGQRWRHLARRGGRPGRQSDYRAQARRPARLHADDRRGTQRGPFARHQRRPVKDLAGSAGEGQNTGS